SFLDMCSSESAVDRELGKSLHMTRGFVKVDLSMLELADALFPIGTVVLIADRISEEASFPSQRGPLVSNQPVNFMCSRCWRAVHKSTSEFHEHTDPVRGRPGIANQEPKQPRCPTHPEPDVAEHRGHLLNGVELHLCVLIAAP